MNSKQLLGLIGGALMIIGPFLPLVSAPIVGDITWFQNGKGDGTIVAILGLGTIILAAANQLRILWATGSISLLMVLYAFYNFHSALGEMKRELNAGLEENPFGGFAAAAANSVQIKWGLPVVLVGAIFAIAAAALKPQGPSASAG